MNGRPNAESPAQSSRALKPLLVVGALLAAGVAVFAGANAHLVYVAVTSQPECVDHLKPGATGHPGFSAAKSSC